MSGKSPVLLIAEDDDQERERLASMAQDLGFRVVQASDGEQALALLRRGMPDILITDYYMPGVDGLGLVKRLRAHPRGARVPVMVITSDDLRRTKIRLLQAGADDFLVKPVDQLEYGARLGALARRAKLVDRLGKALMAQGKARSRLEHQLARPSDMVIALAAAMERGSEQAQVRGHLRRVSELAGLLAHAYRGDEAFAEALRQASVLHDVGMVAVSDHQFHEDGSLTEGDLEEVKAHTLLGAELLRDAGLPELACNIALYHHERWAGSGYPHGLVGDNTPLEARIVAVVDCFDTLLVGRVGGTYRSLGQAWEAMYDAVSSGQLDPDIAGSFRALDERVAQVVRTWPPGVGRAEAWR
jgi:putative nucleotidyltransferase with HDIG domain